MPLARSRSRICGTAAAASSRSTVMRTSSEPARASAATCRAVASMSAVSVLVIDCTTIGAPPPTMTAPGPAPTRTPTVLCRARGPKASGASIVIGLVSPGVGAARSLAHVRRRREIVILAAVPSPAIAGEGVGEADG